MEIIHSKLISFFDVTCLTSGGLSLRMGDAVVSPFYSINGVG